MNEKNIAYLAYFIRSEVNRTQYQRAKWLCTLNKIYIFLKKNIQIPKEIEAKSIIFKSNINSTLLFIFWRIIKIISMKNKIDVVYSLYIPQTILEGFILKKLGFKWIVDIWDHPTLPIKLKKKICFLDKIFLWITKKALKCADLIILAISPKAIKEYELELDKLVRITNGVDLSRTKPEICGKHSDTTNIFYVGYIMKERGIDTLLSAIALLNIPVTLTLVGDMREEDKLWFYQTIKKLNIENIVKYYGVLDNNIVLKLEESADICIYPFPKLEELDYIYPIKVFEYMAMGKAIIATDLEGIRRILKDGFNCILVKPNNARDMAEAIYKLSENPKLRRKLEYNARRSVKRFDWRIIHEKINFKIQKVS